MASGNRGLGIQLSARWPQRARAAIVHPLSLARVGLTAAADRVEEAARSQHEFALLREELRIKDARMERVPPHRRPRYPPEGRLAILELRAPRGWSVLQTAERLHVTGQPSPPGWRASTRIVLLRSVQTPGPVSRSPALGGYLARRRKLLCPELGTARIADVLSRAGLHLRRTTVPMLAGPRVAWLPWSVPQRGPFCCTVTVGVDHFSRRIMRVRTFRRRPSSAFRGAKAGIPRECDPGGR